MNSQVWKETSSSSMNEYIPGRCVFCQRPKSCLFRCAFCARTMCFCLRDEYQCSICEIAICRLCCQCIEKKCRHQNN